ncbi:MAG TPA: DUF2147 domain-containing protein [Thermoanaerobaculales bacterium]|nr:DUF2147 domain-containing protein [Thermoanaerobaculales bacterium]HPA82800.1 DUF2147 domain-containing protein [Thermoanaerobaculales bacterium]HQL28952.1 DUF2147 domain-containing protein [Thermoanaerobaculales bacterium]HQN96004.1 DUF2147 domain-containing protein [Thermoanaerobaculales bacterium]
MRRAALLVTIVALAAVPGIAGEGDAVVGVWATALGTEDGGARIQVYEKDGKYFGKIIWLEKPVYPADDEQGMAGQEKVDRENPEENLRQRPIIGLEMMFDFEYAGDGKWKGGTIYAPDEGKTYKCKMALDGSDTLKVRGFIGVSLLGRTEVWTRYQAAG